jgi:N utilization substance protein B
MPRAEPDPAPAQPRAGRTARRRARELALQALYQWLFTGDEPEVLCGQAVENADWAQTDQVHFRALVRGVIEHAGGLDDALQPFLDRPASSLSPIEHALLLIGGFELMGFPEVPYRVVINEAVELAKVYGGTDGHKYVNGVLDKLAVQLRPHEARKS